ncbi:MULTISPECIES: sterol desaturase family protein [Derxia]|uniref:Sterol desaturase family protein n=1 Tax=Derxia gummosa DSM 723 TaxID=1121388 RepID=A0A8B6X352_9BURK|nr:MULTISPECIES: sterol desaturase family protein [Derxia]
MFDGLPRPALLLPLLAALGLTEAIMLRRRGLGWDWRDAACSLAIAAGQPVSRMLGAAVWGWLFVLAWQWRLWTVPLGTAWGLGLLFLGEELCYYGYHRASHRVRWFWATHAVHHSPERLTFAGAYRLGWTGGLTGTGFFFLPLVLLGFAPAAVFGMLGLNLLYQFWLHTELVPRLGWLEGIVNTPSAHRVHHARNGPYLDRNFGGVLMLWDRLFGSYTPERADLRCDFGLLPPLRSRNPLRVALHEWIALGRDLRRAAGWRTRINLLRQPPGELP